MGTYKKKITPPTLVATFAVIQHEINALLIIHQVYTKYALFLTRTNDVLEKQKLINKNVLAFSSS